MKTKKIRRQASISDVNVMQAHAREAIMLAKISQKRISRHPLNMVFLHCSFLRKKQNLLKKRRNISLSSKNKYMSKGRSPFGLRPFVV